MLPLEIITITKDGRKCGMLVAVQHRMPIKQSNNRPSKLCGPASSVSSSDQVEPKLKVRNYSMFPFV